MAPDMSELVLHARLETVFPPEHPNHTRHIRTYQGTHAWQRRVRAHEIWERRRRLGKGAFGTIWLEECVERPDGVTGRSVRAVKVIRKDGHGSLPHRELEAIFKFSHENVRPVMAPECLPPIHAIG
jgi:hypothetical protein